MLSVCLPSDALLQHLPSYLGFSYLGGGVSLHGLSRNVQPLLHTLDKGISSPLPLLAFSRPSCTMQHCFLYVLLLLPAAAPDLGHGVARLGCSCAVAAWHSWPCYVYPPTLCGPQMCEFDYKESWVPKNQCFWTVVLERTLENPLECKKIQPVNPKGNQTRIFIGRTVTEAETLILWPPDVKNWLTRKDPDAGKDWRQKGMTEDEMVVWHHWLDGYEFEQAPGICDGQGSLACCSP